LIDSGAVWEVSGQRIVWAQVKAVFTKIVYSTVGDLMASPAVVQNRVHEFTEAAAILSVDVGLNGSPDKLVPRFEARSAEVFIRPIFPRREKTDIGNRDFAFSRLPQRQREADGAED